MSLNDRKPIRPVSRKRARETRTRAAVRAEVLARDMVCVAAPRVPEVDCWHPRGEPLDVHELVQRSLWPAGWLEPSNCVAICRRHHEWVDANIDAAHERGLLRHSWERTGQ